MKGLVDLDELMQGCRYVILAKNEAGEIVFCPLPLNGHETMDEAVARFKDCRNVLVEHMRAAAGRHAIDSVRFDGKPSAELEAHAKRLAELGV